MIRNFISIVITLFLAISLLAGQEVNVDSMIIHGQDLLKSRNYKELDGLIQMIEANLQARDPEMKKSVIDFGQLKAKSLFMQFKPEEAADALMRIFPLKEQYYGAAHTEVAQTAVDIGHYLRDYEKAKPFIQKALGIYRGLNDSLKIASCLLNLGIKSYRTFKLPQAQSQFKEGMSFLENAPKSAIRARLDFYLGRYYKAIGDYETAVFYMRQSLNLLQENYPNDPVIINVARDLGLLLKDQGQYEDPIAVFRRPIRGENEKISLHRFLAEADLWSEIGITLSESGKDLESIETLSILVQAVEDSLGRYYIYLNYPLAYLISAYLADGQEDQAKAELMHADSTVEANSLQIHVDYARFCLRMSEAFDQIGNHEMRSKYNDLAIRALGADPQNIETYAEVSQIDVLLSILNSKSRYLFDTYLKDGGFESQEYEAHLSNHLSVMNFMNEHQMNPDVQLASMENNYHVLENGITYFTRKFETTQNESDFLSALTLAENGRDHLLNEAQVRRDFGKDLGISEAFIEQDAKLQQELANIEVQIFNENDKVHLQKLESDKRQIQSDLETLTLSLDNEFVLTDVGPGKSALTKRNLSGIPAKVSVIELFQTAENLCVFIIEKGNQELFKINEPNDFKSAIALFPKELSDPKNDDAWKLTAKQMGTFFDPILEKLSKKSDHLVIIPHGSWSAIPFEMIPIERTGDDHLLADHFAISYANSLSTFLNGHTRQRKKDLKFLAGFAPSYKKMSFANADTTGMDLFAELVRSGDFHLPSAIAEVEEITRMTAGQAFFNDEASESTFKRIAGDYQILHFSMHALEEPTNPKFSRLLFSQSTDQEEDNFVFANELSAMRLNADLAVLSACNTGSGKFQKGEGTMSLSRAFQYAGVPSIVHSLWKVPDQATSQIMIAFYKHLLTGMGKADALQKAKQDYLSSAIVVERRHPFYWAGFVLNGNTDPIIGNNTNRYLLWIGLGMLALLLFGIWFFKRAT